MDGKEQSPDFNIKEYIERPNSNLKWSRRIDYRSFEQSIVEEQVHKKGLPLVISNTTVSWKRDRQMFSFDWLKHNFGRTSIIPRDNDNLQDRPEMYLAEYLDYISLPDKDRTRRIYGKDVPCPPEWKNYISSKLAFFWVKGENDLMKNILPELQAETLLTYVGTTNNCTPGHVDILGTLGHNVMVYADEGAYALWFLVAQEDRDKAAAHWRQCSGGLLYSDTQFLSIEDLLKAPFTIYVCEQKEGDLVLIPSESVHQVINKNGRSVKVAWNTMNYNSIEASYFSALKLYRSLGKQELYRVKAVAYYSLVDLTQQASDGRASDNALDEFPPLFNIIEDMIQSETIDLEALGLRDVEVFQCHDEIPHKRTCDFCKCDIWNRCYHCDSCGDETGYDICLACVAEGRGCPHKANFKLMEYLTMERINQTFEQGKDAYQKLVKSQKRKRKNKKQFTEWKSRVKSDEISVGTVSYRLVKLIYSKENTNETCHQCEKIQPYTTALYFKCSKCDKSYCTKCLWNRYGEKGLDVIKNTEWKCPACRSCCNCNPCLESRGVSPNDSSLEKILGELLDAYYPFQNPSSPNQPAPSDSKPVFQNLSLKKRKMFLISSSTPTVSPTPIHNAPNTAQGSPPTSAKNPKSPPVKMTERQQIKYLMNLPPGGESKVKKEVHALAPPLEPQDEKPLPTLETAPIVEVKVESPRPVATVPVTTSNSGDPFEIDIKDIEDMSDTGVVNGDFDKSKNSQFYVDHHSTILVRNLAYGVNQDDLRELFKPCGNIEIINIPIDRNTGKLKGYGFVRFEKRADAEVAMAKFQNFPYQDRKLEIEWSVDKATQKKIYNPAKNVLCYKCGEHGHIARDCPREEKVYSESMPIVQGDPQMAIKDENMMQMDRRDEREVHKAYMCFKCGKWGHVASDCKERDIDGSGFKGAVCFKCGVPGHLANKCDKKAKGCFICGKEGHIAAECPDRFTLDPVRALKNDEAEPVSKYRKTETAREYERDYDKDRDRDREYLRDKKFDDRDRYRDSRDHRDSHYRDRERDRDYRDRDKTRDRQDRYSHRDSRDYRDNRDRDRYYDNKSYSDSKSYSNYDKGNSEEFSNYNSQFAPNSNAVHSDDRYNPEETFESQYSQPVNANVNVPPQQPILNQDTMSPNSLAQQVQNLASYYYGNSSLLGMPQNNSATLASLLATMSGLSIPQQFPPIIQQPSQPPVNSNTSESLSPSQKSEEGSEKRRTFKFNVSNIVVKQLSKYFAPGQIESKEHFKQLSRNIVNALVERETRFAVDKETDHKIKKYVEAYYQKYHQYRSQTAKLEQWLQSSTVDSPL